eukprot:scaffold482_cov266-Amphora_coffeaeformis.AAC.56
MCCYCCRLVASTPSRDWSSLDDTRGVLLVKDKATTKQTKTGTKERHKQNNNNRYTVWRAMISMRGSFSLVLMARTAIISSHLGPLFLGLGHETLSRRENAPAGLVYYVKPVQIDDAGRGRKS